jgi:hypothetical protein
MKIAGGRVVQPPQTINPMDSPCQSPFYEAFVFAFLSGSGKYHSQRSGK